MTNMPTRRDSGRRSKLCKAKRDLQSIMDEIERDDKADRAKQGRFVALAKKVGMPLVDGYFFLKRLGYEREEIHGKFLAAKKAYLKEQTRAAKLANRASVVQAVAA